MAGRTYDHSEFVSVRYYLGTHGCADSTARYRYYGMSGTPNLMFNGTHQIVGASIADVQGGQYMDVIQSRYFDPAPVRVVIDSFDPATGGVSATVTMYSTDYTLSEDFFHFFLIEDGVNAEDTHVTRAMISDRISLEGAGNEAPFNASFTIDPDWNQANLRIIGIVQRQDKEIVQTGSSYDQPTSSVRAMVPFSRVKIGPSSGVDETEYFTVMNLGQTGSFTIRIVIDLAPTGWTVDFSDSDGVSHVGPLSFDLNPQESTTFKANVTPGSAGYIQYHFEVTSPTLDKNLEIPFVYITDDVDALLVDDDGGNGYGHYFTAALDDVGLSYGVWDLSSTKLTDDVASATDLLIWNVGLGYPSLDATDRVFVAQHLDAGKSLFISGQDIGWDLVSGQSGNTDVAFYEGYLHADYISDDVNRYDIDGVTGDPVSHGLTLHIRGGDGANNQDYPSRVARIDNDGFEMFSYSGEEWGAGVRSVDSVSGAKVVYLAFGFEAIDNAEDRSALMGAVIDWLGPEIPGEGMSPVTPPESQ
jgi:hypothetical protein